MQYLFRVTSENLLLNYINFSVCERITHFFFGFKYGKQKFA